MTNEEFENFVEVVLTDCRAILYAKGRDYSGLEDRFTNFKECAEEIDTTVEKIMWTYIDKHLRAIKAHVRGEILTGEPLSEKIKDIINYLLLLSAYDNGKNRLYSAPPSTGILEVAGTEGLRPDRHGEVLP